jgi:hypothetical protein
MEGSEFESWWGQQFSISYVLQTGHGVHAASYSTVTEAFFPGEKRPGLEADQVKKTHIHSTVRLKVVELN